MDDMILFVEFPLRSGGRTLVQVAAIINIEERKDLATGPVAVNTTGGWVYLSCTYDEAMTALGQAAEAIGDLGK